MMAIDQTLMKTVMQNGFSAGASTYAAAAAIWASAAQQGCLSIVPASTTVAAAGSALQTALTTAFAAPNAIPGMETAFTAFGASVGLGMAPAFTATPPAGAVGFASLFASTRTSHSQAAQDMSSAIVAWLHTGLGIPPSGPAVPWT